MTTNRPLTAMMAAIAFSIAGCDTLDRGAISEAFAREKDPVAVTDYRTASEADFRVVGSSLTQLKGSAAGQADAINGVVEVEIRFHRGDRTWITRAVQSVRLAVPVDAVKGRRVEVSHALESFVRYAATRPDATATHLFVAAPLLADRNWLAVQLRHAGAVGVIEEQAQAYTAIGWDAPDLATDRPVIEAARSAS